MRSSGETAFKISSPTSSGRQALPNFRAWHHLIAATCMSCGFLRTGAIAQETLKEEEETGAKAPLKSFGGTSLFIPFDPFAM